MDDKRKDETDHSMHVMFATDLHGLPSHYKTLLETAEKAAKYELLVSARSLARVVFPEPGGPHNIIEGI